ncbi:hypothetical protein OG345_41080 (plasmid) [Streptomyces sp. NBC_01220]|uniref:DUF6919 domain-containing protein n=1 Tax=Streptomyces sp. NBC_01220 TaxID=2903781 RepID=UPI00352CE6E5|nr:hypothetical protein OG345_41080 [Streptomyces sp. NBC_01220]
MKIRLPWMSRAERQLWRAASTLDDLGELTAAWLEGKMQSQPAWQPRFGPDDETLPHVPVLAIANRGGYVTNASQPGRLHTGADGTEWRQRAAVEGFVSDSLVLQRLIDTAEQAGLDVVLNDADHRTKDAIPVTLRNGKPHTTFGRTLGPGDLKVMWRGFPNALILMADAHQLTIVDPDFGPSARLWDVLAHATTRPTPYPPAPAPTVVCTSCGCSAIGWSICADGCSGVTDQADGRCTACINPNVLIDWSKEIDDQPNECALCGAPHYSARPYCSTACKIADGSGPVEFPGATEPSGPTRA